MADLREAILHVARHFDAVDPKKVIHKGNLDFRLQLHRIYTYNSLFRAGTSFEDERARGIAWTRICFDYRSGILEARAVVN